MNILKVIHILDKLKTENKLKSYAIFGAVGASYYMEPVYTNDVDIIVFSESDSDYIIIWNELKKYAQKIETFGFRIDNTEVQIFPSTISSLFQDSLKTAKNIKVDGTFVRVVDKEHLILLFLSAGRQRDKFKASILLETADLKYLKSLLERFDKDDKIKNTIKKFDY
jgi:predicted nucleotidyltransferase